MILQSGADLRITTSAAANVDVTASYADRATPVAPGGQQTSIASAATTTVVDAPSGTERIVRFLSATNTHATTTNAVTVVLRSGGTSYSVMRAVLGPGETLAYTDTGGFAVLTSTGLPKTSQSQGAQSAAVNALNIAVVSTDVVNNNATANTLQDATGLAFPAVAGGVYWFEATVLYRSAALTTGVRFTVNGPSFSEFSAWQQTSLTATTFGQGNMAAYSTPAAAFASSAATTGNIALVGGIIKASADGTVQIQFASEISSSAITVMAGSLIRWVQTL